MMGAQLDYLCGIHVMGWRLSSGVEMYSDGQWYTGSYEAPDTQRKDHEWNPSTCLDDALLCLERAANSTWSLRFGVQENDDPTYTSDFPADLREYDDVYTARCWDRAGNVCFGVAAKPTVAMCLCALRAMGIPESEISIAMDED